MEAYIIKFIPFAKVLFSFVLMLTGIRLKAGIGPSILVGGVAMGLMFGMTPLPIVETAGHALIDQEFLFLLAIVVFILVLSDAMERSGQSRRLMDSLAGFLTSPRLRLIFFPALIGLLPMPGGAVFSAPMVKTVSENMHITNSQRAVLNYWFRHIWELVWPLYPGMILTLALANLKIVDLAKYTWPATPLMLILGWLFFLRPGVLGAKNITIPMPLTGRSKMTALKEGLPLIVAIVGAIGLESSLSVFAPSLPMEYGVVFALVAALACVMVQNRMGWKFLKAVLGKKSLWSMALVVASIFIFKDILQAAGVVTEMSHVAGGKAALFASAIFLPFLVGLVAGINAAFVGATFPLLLGLLHTLGMDAMKVPFIVLATFSGFSGVLISPIHICFILTCQYFHCDIGKTWRRIVIPSILFAVIGMSLFFLYR